jgi:hypothetical protein
MGSQTPVPVIVPGHGLRDEGKPFMRSPLRETFVRVRPSISEGHGLCNCGEFSAILGSDAARKRWYRDHKAEAWRALQAANR